MLPTKLQTSLKSAPRVNRAPQEASREPQESFKRTSFRVATQDAVAVGSIQFGTHAFATRAALQFRRRQGTFGLQHGPAVLRADS
eukprot:7220505-Pyramimonas_sp.AAC.1